MAGVGINHQSNGRGDPLSRSWNRVIFTVGLDRENWALVLRPWWRVPDGNDDDNPDIEDYIGRGDAMLTYSKGGHEFTVLARHSLRTGDKSHGAVQLDWGFPIHRSFRGHIQAFHGYGESLIDYNHKATYIGLGISLLEWY
jgi:phospholipase A1